MIYIIEEWRDIDGFPGYRVSSLGRVGSRKTYHGYIGDTEHILKPRTNPNGYRVVVLHDESRRPHQLLVHRLVAKTFMPVDDYSLVVDHLDNNTSNNHLSNLEWVTGKENSIRAYRNGLYEPVFAKTRRPIVVTDLWTGNESYYEGINEAARDLGYSPAIFSKVANGLKDRVGRYTVEFAGPEERLLYT